MHNSLFKGRRVPAVIALLLIAIVIDATQSNGSPAGRALLAHRAAASATTTTAAPETSTSAATPETTVAPTAAVAPPAPAAPPVPQLPSGKGMWLWQPQYVEGGDPAAIVARAQGVGLSHLYVRMGSSVDGFTAGPFLDSLLPVAHAAGLKIVGWDFPYFDDVPMDVLRAFEEISYTTPDGQKIDAFSPDIETWYEGVNLSADNAALYGSALRDAVGPSYPLIATVPRPSAPRQADYPYAEVIASFDAVAPMVYWINIAPDGAAAEAVDYLAQFGKPVMPIGQAYDGGLEGGTPGTPTPDEIDAFMNASAAHGARGVSFWSWQHATDDMWGAIQAGVTPG